MAVIALFGFWVYVDTRRRAIGSPRIRDALLRRTALGVVTGAVLSLWLPQRMSVASESPASMVAVVLLWIVGGGLLFLSIASFAGAYFAPRARAHRRPLAH